MGWVLAAVDGKEKDAEDEILGAVQHLQD